MLLALFVPWAANAQETLPVHDNNLSTNRGVPIYAYYFDNYTKAQHVFPASDLAEMEGGTITSIKYFYSTSYSASSPTAFSTATESYVSINVYLKEVESATISSLTDFSSDTPAFSGKFIFETDGTVELVLSNPYTYGGGNLLIGVENPVKGGTYDYHNVYFFVETGLTSGASTYNYNSTSLNDVSYSSSNTAASLPKTVFTYTPGGSSTATPPGVTTSDAVANLTNTSVTLGGTITDMGGATGVYAGICYSTTATPTTSDGHAHIRYTATGPITQNITGLLPSTKYYYRAYAYNSANSLADPTYGDIYSFTTGGTITLDQPANGEISVSVAGGTATTSNTYALPNQSVTLTATAVSGYSFDNWIVSGVTGTASGSSYTFTMPTNNVTVTASIVPTSGGSSSDFYYELATSVESGEKYLIVNGSSTTISASTTFYAMEWNNTSSTSGYLDYGTPTFKDSEKQKITGITPHTSGHALSDFVWTINASGSDYTISAENGGSTYYLIETIAGDGNLHSYTTSNANYSEEKATWTIYPSSNDGFIIHNPYWHEQYTSGTRYYYLYRTGSSFENYYSGSAPESITTSNYRMYLYKETSVTTYAITATASPAEGGTVAGSDYYANGASCTLTATPAFGYDFVSWTEGGVVVSLDAAYTFTVSGARTLVANFESQGSCIKPTDLAQVGPQAAHQAQLSWTENSGATQWQVVYSTDSEFNPDDATPVTVNENPATITTGLNQATTYYFRVRAICGQNSESGWSNQGTFSTISGRQAPTVSYDPATLTTDEVTVTWTGVATNVLHQSYDLYYSTNSVMPTTLDPTTFIVGLTGNSHPLTGLTGDTKYYVWVRDNCGDDGLSDWSTPESFTTACDAKTVDADHEFFQSFDDTNFPNCWDNPSEVISGSTRQWIRYSGTNHTTGGSGSAYSGYYGPIYMMMPELAIANYKTDVKLTFWSYNTWTGSYNKNSVVLLNGNEEIELWSPASVSESWEESTINLSAYKGQTIQLAFKYEGSNAHGWYVDDVKVAFDPTCLPVGTLANATEVKSRTAKLSWTLTDDTQSSWDVAVKAASDEDFIIRENAANTNVGFVLTGLTPSTSYTVKVRANCGAEDGTGAWSNTITFTTDVACPAPTNVAANNVTNNSAEISWEGDAANYQLRYRESEAPVAPTTATVILTVQGDIWGDGSGYQMVLDADATFIDNYDETAVDYSDCEYLIPDDATYDPDGSVVFNESVSITITPGTYDWVIFNPSPGDAVYIAAGDNKYGNVGGCQDNYVFEAGKTYEFVVSYDANVGTDGYDRVDVTITNTAKSGEAKDNAWTVVTDATSPQTISPLTAEKTYEVQVQAVCGGEDGESDWTTSITFTTLSNCATPAELNVTDLTYNSAKLNWSGAQDTYNVRYAKLVPGEAVTTTEDFSGDYTLASYNADGVLPDGWVGIKTGSYKPHITNNTTLGTTYDVVGIGGGVSGTDQFMYMGNASIAILPQYSNITAISFQYAYEGASNGTLTVGYCTENINGSSFTALTNGGSSFTPGATTLQTVNLTAAAIAIINENNGYLAFRWAGTSNYGVGIDNIAITTQSYVPEAWNEDNVNVNSPLPIGSLEMGNSYVWQVQGVNASCGSEGLTDWSEVATFTTPYPTFTKTIEAVGNENWENGKGGYYFIASPVDEFVTPAADNGFITDNYDLYYFSQTGDSEGNEWINYKPNGAFDLTNGKGYLYASKEGATLTFTGTPGTNGNVPLDNYDANARFKGWNLIGNPFAQDAYITKPFYTLENSDTYTSNEAGTAIHAMQGVLIIADAEETTVTFTTTAPAANNSKLNMNLRCNNKQLDNAILVFGGEQKLGKMTFRENSSKIYMPVEGKDYAITSVEGQVGEMPVSFKAEENGTYSLSFTNEEVSFSYLHLIDNMTGNDVNLLQTPSYTFDARTTDYASRFKLVFAVGSSANDETFGFVNASGNFCIFGIEGEATVQVIDVLGHVLSSEQFSGSYERQLNVAPGVYMIRLINGNDVKIQKVVVR